MSVDNRYSRLTETIVIVLLLSLLCLWTVHFRSAEFDHPSGSENLEAPYHVLLTVTALNQGGIRNHWLLPTVSLGGDENKHVPWGATIPTKGGDYIYTSFPVLGFLAPWAVFNVLEVPPTIRAIAYFNATLGWLSAVLLLVLLLKVLRSVGLSGPSLVAGLFASCAISIFSREALRSTGVAYWSQSLYQPILILSILAAISYLEDARGGARRRLLLVALTLAGPLVEWTAYVFNAGLALSCGTETSADHGSWPCN